MDQEPSADPAQEAERVVTREHGYGSPEERPPRLLTRKALRVSTGVIAATTAVVVLTSSWLTPSGYEPPEGWEVRRTSSTAERVDLALAVPYAFTSRRVLDAEGTPEAHYVAPDGHAKIKVLVGASEPGETTTQLAQKAAGWYQEGARDEKDTMAASGATQVGDIRHDTIDGEDAALVTVRYAGLKSRAPEQVTNLYLLDGDRSYYRVQVWAQGTTATTAATRTEEFLAEVRRSIDVHPA
ncbi:hypothetical protein [Streptomyces sp. NPDC097619]|uniref:hypothetical protein n=1 Tax=Streptomyces sp. NPDC097619 TaxID=3157228 RepID=UPI00331D582F